MDDKLYILAVIAWVAYSFYSAYKKSQKKRQAAPPVIQHEQEEEQPEPQWYDSSSGHRQVENVPPVKPSYKPITETYFQSDDSIEELSSIENISVEKLQLDAQKFSKKIQVADTNEGKSHMLDMDFDESELRKAVIYSEIINRKY